ncbi:MAG: ATP-binding protein [Pirellulales bacterium]|nr:ATP-binding protein [Pirellulales bacterium]
MQDYEHSGKFYLGREYDLKSGATKSNLLLYDSRDLTTHAVCVGMTGSGKTGLCLSLIEEAAIDGIPVIAIDPKGDLGNLLFAFPDLQPNDFRPWIDESIAQRKGMTPEEFAESMAQLWRTGLAEWGQDGERIRKFKEAADVAIYTPGSTAGLPLTVLKSFSAPPPEILTDRDAMRERIAAAAAGVLALLGIDVDPVKSREHILLSNLLDLAWREGRDLDLAKLIAEIQNPPMARVGVLDLDTFFPEKDRIELAMRLNNLLASPSFAAWMDGEPLHIDRLLHTSEGKPRIAILSIAHLSDEERMFFVTILLGEVLAWMRSQPGTSSLRAILYMDEIFGYFPPSANPPSKRPMLTLLKQARAFGLGIVLSTQNPVDLDYKGLSNAGTWFLGRLQTERDKMRVLEGLEGASAQAGATFDKQKMEAILAGLGSRIFLMNNVHDNAPVVFHTRWALSYLRGPMTREQIKMLMANRKDAPPEDISAKETKPSKPPEVVPPSPIPPAELDQKQPRNHPPDLDQDIKQRFVQLREPLSGNIRIEYHPGLHGAGTMRYFHKPSGMEYRHAFSLLAQLNEELPDTIWDQPQAIAPDRLQETPDPSGQFPADLASIWKQEKSYTQWRLDLKNRQYRGPALIMYHCGELDAYSRLGPQPETRDAFVARMKALATKRLAEGEKKIEHQYESRIATLQRRKRWSHLIHFFPMVFKFLVGILAHQLQSKAARDLAKSTAREMNRGRGRRGSSQAAKDASQIERLEAAMERELQELEMTLDPRSLEIDDVPIRPFLKNIDVPYVALAWLPWIVDESGRLERGW